MSESADRQLIHVNAFANDEIANTSTNSDSSCEMHMRGVFSSIDSFSLRISYSTQSVIDGYAGPKDSPEPVVMEVPCNKTTNLEFSTSYAMMKPNWKQIENFVDTDTGHVSCSTLLDQVHGSNSQDTRIVLDGGMIIHCQVRNQSQSTALTETNQTPISIEFTTIEVPVGWWLNNKESFTNANQQMCGSEFIFW
ncbi:hypothetical protein PHYBLDRAFT_158473 [Phycomyces blakesleeanus NRRL 1555(-)]|uniref:Uncharacterized protein n=2 Tax=Phycomyces blakesleeanus TaxID=4837 RepID=A0A162UF29_PHYB8|nr:hypothetical protein PHYBLDRAFT_158473 [Phycomyces blakesleeanus NRRL 1555(-)]OAD74663.1 hypothetical protein PHYBLDRAFT_158473 [Phycomyces blakesleeanus NRRL 1555(-)]|eukprot:XP_018292703.1 hypothetical protein PHYBLDRAFT_158473 [Phycomyces blakesleeanus NRRL 1555(-)]